MKQNKCVIRCSSNVSLSCGYTKVKVFPDDYRKIATIASCTGRTIQDVVEKLLDFALNNCVIEDDNGAAIEIKY